MDNTCATFLGKSCQLSVASVHFVAAYLYLFVFLFGVVGAGGGRGRGGGGEGLDVALIVALIVLVPKLTHLPQL